MLVIRFFRTGKKNQPSFKIVVTDKRESSTTGRSVEEVGFWNPLTKEKVLRQERIKYWLSVGAKPSPTVFNLLISEKIIEGKKIDVHKKAKMKEKPAVAGSASVAKATSAKEAAVAGKEEKPPAEEKKEEPAKEEKPVLEKVAKETPKEEKKEETPKTK